VLRSSVYEVTLYLLAGVLVIGLIANLLVRPVVRKWFMSDAEIAGLQGTPGGGALVPSSATASLNPASALAWAVVGIPILWGVWITLDKVWMLFS
jgi:hypothetical protein